MKIRALEKYLAPTAAVLATVGISSLLTYCSIITYNPQNQAERKAPIGNYQQARQPSNYETSKSTDTKNGPCISQSVIGAGPAGMDINGRMGYKFSDDDNDMGLMMSF